MLLSQLIVIHTKRLSQAFGFSVLQFVGFFFYFVTFGCFLIVVSNVRCIMHVSVIQERPYPTNLLCLFEFIMQMTLYDFVLTTVLTHVAEFCSFSI